MADLVLPPAPGLTPRDDVLSFGQREELDRTDDRERLLLRSMVRATGHQRESQLARSVSIRKLSPVC